MAKSYRQVFEEYAKSQPDYDPKVGPAELIIIFNDPFFGDLERIADNYKNQFIDAITSPGAKSANKSSDS